MTYWIDTPQDFIPLERGRLSRTIFCHTIPGAATLAVSVLFGVWTLYMRPAAPPAVEAIAANPAAAVGSNPYGALFDPGFLSGSTLASAVQVFPLDASLDPAPAAQSVASAEPESLAPGPAPSVPRLGESAPLPIPRPPELKKLEGQSPLPAPSRRFAQQTRTAVPAAASQDHRSFFERLFGLGQPPGPVSGPVLAYAAPENGALGNRSGILGNMRGAVSSPPGRYDRWTAVYDLAAHTVYLPNGTRLEAHSGLGNRLDDPRYVHERMRGATPPNVYELQPREQLFHGVPALRLIPVGSGDLYGRTGLLAHTYMLGPNGDSNGCVSFRNYSAFLQAYQNGEIKRLAVVARLN